MATQIKWVRPTTENVKALWTRIRDGQFKTASGVPRFQLSKDVEDPEILYLTWTYDKTALVRCTIDDFPAYLPDEDQGRVKRILSRIAGRELRPPKVDLTEIDTATDPVRRYASEAESIFVDKLVFCGLDEETLARVLRSFRETLAEMVSLKMIKGS